MAALEDLIREVTADVRMVPGVVATPDAPPEQLGVFPALVVYPRTGFWRFGSASGSRSREMRWGTHTLAIVLHVDRADLAYDMARALPFTESVPNALLAGFARDRFNQAAVTLGDPTTPGTTPPVRYEMGPSQWGGVDTIAITFSLDVSVEEEINR